MGDSFFDFTQYDIAEDSIDTIATFSGNKESDLLILLRKSGFTADDQAFLKKVIAATTRSLDESSVYLLDDTATIRTAQIPNYSNYKYVIISGISPKEVSMSVSVGYYIPIKLGAQDLLFIPDLSQITNDQSEKKNLWNSLKNIFGL